MGSSAGRFQAGANGFFFAPILTVGGEFVAVFPNCTLRSEIRGRCLGIVIGAEKLFIVSDLYLNTMDIKDCRKTKKKKKKKRAHLLSKPSPIVFKSKAKSWVVNR